MRPVVTDGLVWSVDLSVIVVIHANTAEPIEMPFGLWTHLGLRNHVLDGDAHWRHLADTIETSVCGSNAALLWLPCIADVEIIFLLCGFYLLVLFFLT